MCQLLPVVLHVHVSVCMCTFSSPRRPLATAWLLLWLGGWLVAASYWLLPAAICLLLAWPCGLWAAAAAVGCWLLAARCWCWLLAAAGCCWLLLVAPG